jgi:hypothetical protein
MPGNSRLPYQDEIITFSVPRRIGAGFNYHSHPISSIYKPNPLTCDQFTYDFSLVLSPKGGMRPYPGIPVYRTKVKLSLPWFRAGSAPDSIITRIPSLVYINQTL